MIYDKEIAAILNLRAGTIKKHLEHIYQKLGVQTRIAAVMYALVLLMSIIGNGSNVLLDYLMIVRWGWESIGAGLATAISQYLALISTYTIFTNLSAAMGTIVLAENGLLLQIALLSQFTIQGVGMTTQTLTGNFQGKGSKEQMI